MAVLLMGLLLLLAITGHSSATYCICKDGLSDSVLQKNIDYACGAGADCTAITQGGSCYNPNTVKDHCNYAVNSYFQRKGQATGSCDFAGTAIQNPSLPSQSSSGCVYPSSASAGTPTTPSTPGTGTGNGTGTGTGGTGTGTGGTGTGGTGSTTIPGSTTPFGGLGPSGSGGFNSPDGSNSGRLYQGTKLFQLFTLTLLFSGLMMF